MTEAEHQEIVAAIILGLLAVCATLSFLTLIIAMTEPRPVVNEAGINSHDLYRAVESCKPWDSTFEQELACYQAVYGGIK